MAFVPAVVGDIKTCHLVALKAESRHDSVVKGFKISFIRNNDISKDLLIFVAVE